MYEKRKGLQAALLDLEMRRAEVLLVEDLDRLSRDTDNDKVIDRRIEDAGAVLVCSEAQLIGSATYDFYARCANISGSIKTPLLAEYLKEA